jgi:hypothetical protein
LTTLTTRPEQDCADHQQRNQSLLHHSLLSDEVRSRGAPPGARRSLVTPPERPPAPCVTVSCSPILPPATPTAYGGLSSTTEPPLRRWSGQFYIRNVTNRGLRFKLLAGLQRRQGVLACRGRSQDVLPAPGRGHRAGSTRLPGASPRPDKIRRSTRGRSRRLWQSRESGTQPRGGHASVPGTSRIGSTAPFACSRIGLY